MEQFGKYKLVRRIGRGGMAEVYLARTAVAQGLSKDLVIKKIHPAFARSQQFQAMFVDEAKIALGLNHPGIVQVFDFGSVGDSFFLAMEHVEGVDMLRLLRQAQKTRPHLPYGIAAYVTQKVAQALDYAHRKTDDFGEPLGIVHRDISPHNVLVSWDGAVKIVDFGIARARTITEEEGVIKGKFAYMSPEQARGEAVDRRSDVFSAGALLFELVCGRQLFEGKGKEVLEKVKSGDVPRPQEVNPSVPDGLARALEKALAFHRSERFQTARDFQQALGRFLFRHAADADDGPIDSSTLAAFVTATIPDSTRPPLPPSADGSDPLLARGTGRSNDTNGSLSESGSHLATPLPGLSETRERKHVFVIEGQVRELSALEAAVGAERAAELLDQFSHSARDVAFKHDAHVHRIDKAGLTLVVGLPVAAEDDPSRAIRAGLSLIDTLEAIVGDMAPTARLGIGVQRGVAVLHRRGGSRFRYELSASATAVARRLARAAAGDELLVGAGVFRVARDEWTFEELDTVDVATEPDLVNPSADPSADTPPGFVQSKVYALRGAKDRGQQMRERSLGPGELVGRELELKGLRDIYRAVLVARDKRQVLIAGEAGLGKRSLVSAFLDTIAPGEAIVVRAAARSTTSYTPYGIFADLARDLLAVGDGADPAEVRRRLEMVTRALFGDETDTPEVKSMVRAVEMMLGVRAEDPIDNDSDPAERKQLILAALSRVERKLEADKPLVVVSEDVHWADDQSSELFSELSKLPSVRPIYAISTARPDAKMLEGAAAAKAEVIMLSELDPEAARELVTRRFAEGEHADDLADKIVSRTGGNPFFINEMLDALIERNVVRADPDGLLHWVRRDAPVQVPTRIEALVSARIDGLDPAQKDVLMHTSVLGRSFTSDQVTALLGRDVKVELAALVDRGMMNRRSDGLLSFRDDMTMTVAYRMLPEEERRTLHTAAARRLAEAPGYRKGQDDPIIARHLELAVEDREAAARYIAAARYAIGVGGTGDAMRQLARALKLLGPDEHELRFEAYERRESILRHLARRGDQRADIQKMLATAKALEAPGKLALAQCREAQYLFDTGSTPAAQRSANLALASARVANHRLLQAEALRLLASVQRQIGEHEAALRLCDQALDLCGDDSESLLQRASILNARGTVQWHQASATEAVESFAEALVIYRMLKKRRREARVLNNMGIAFSELGDPEQALAHYKSSLKIDQELGSRASMPLKLGNIGQTYNDLGDPDRAEKYLRKGIKLAEKNGDERSNADMLISLGQVFFQREEYARSLEMFERGLQLATESRDRYEEIRALIYVGLAQLETGKPAEGALELARSATRLARKMPMPVGEMYSLAVEGLALARLGRDDDAVERSRAALARYEANKSRDGGEMILHVHTTLCEAAGLLDEARETAGRARDLVRERSAALQDPALRKTYLGAKRQAAIARDHARLTGAQPT